MTEPAETVADRPGLEQVRRWIDQDAIFRCSPEEQYQPGIPAGKLRSNSPGQFLTWLFHLRRIIHNPERLKTISELIFDRILCDLSVELWGGQSWDRRNGPFQFAGLETASIPLLIGLARAALDNGIAVNTFSVRKERKGYGLFHLIDGAPNEHPVILVDDLVSSGRSVARCADTIVHELKLRVISKAFAIVRFNDKPLLTTAGEIEVRSLFKVSDFDLSFDPAKAWFPQDCQRRGARRPDH